MCKMMQIHVFAVLVLALGVAALADENPHGTLAIDCQSCHVTASWTEMRDSLSFDHNTQTKFQLVGRHNAVGCAECHTSLIFTEAGTQCIDCHTDIHRGQFTANCEV